MTRVLSCVNQKGGVGKTTLCANLADAMMQAGKRVLVLDMDPQGHLSQYLGVRVQDGAGMYGVLQGDVSIAQCLRPVREHCALVPCGAQLVRLEAVQMKAGRGLRLRKALQSVKEDWDMIMIDCPPSNGFLVVNAIAASDELIIPVTPDFLGLSGLSEMFRQIQRYEQVMGVFKHLWVVISRYQKRKVSQQAEAKIRHYFGQQVVPQVIHERAAIAESPGHALPIRHYAPRSRSVREFRAVAQHILQEA